MTRKEFDEILNLYCNMWTHLYRCIGYSEGQECCLEKRHVRDMLWLLVTGDSERVRSNLAEIKAKEKEEYAGTNIGRMLERGEG